ncbi:Crossover junction endonuclease MUS81 [Holothuria leucospilota]|uniref:Crossover junction endonuclease MUS81 n=1 Tax=Holothuria leucospilota TaxID=206669 RepID=A0A9Q1HDC4_HOLLE|nr:Crossover junction endonuclease MUS81 [Holothuria leucospilota]
MSKQPLKRRKKINPDPNPLFTRWLTEWRDEAATKGWKTQYAYGKALRSLKKYPMPLSSGKSCSILDSFGNKICNMLDKKLEEYIAENGPVERGVNKRPQENKRNPVSSSINISDSDSDTNLDADSLQGSVHEAPSGQRKRKTPNKSPREYVPVYRSGPYALILTLYRNHIKENSRGFMRKEELMEAAQPLADKSFSRPDPGSYYTAWSSMSTLINKELVAKEGHPPRFSITDKGCELAHKLEQADVTRGQPQGGPILPTGSTHSHHQTASSRSKAVPELPRMSSDEGSDADGCHGDDDNSRGKIYPSTSTVSENRFIANTTNKDSNYLTFWYIDDRGRKVSMKDSAAVMIDDEVGVGFLVRCDRLALEKSGRKYQVDLSRSCEEGSDVYAYLANENAEDTCTMLSQESNIENISFNSSTYFISGKPLLSSQSSVSSSYLGSVAPSHSSMTATSTSYGSSISRPHTESDRSTQSSMSQESSVSSLSQSSAVTEKLYQESQKAFSPDPLFVFQPGDFDIVLCVDNCETVGGNNRGQKQLLLPELMRNGVNMDVRKLQVGDFLWVAREKVAPRIGQLKMPERREVVLDYVVERKRMDDLCSSMQDGRFREQKFRLKNCGLRKPIYLVEEHGSSEHLSIPQATLFQATVNTQVSDGFYVKHTKDIKESVAYLTIMTRYLQSLYSTKTLIAYKKQDLEKMNVEFSLSDDTQQLMAFKDFNQNSIKNKESTVNETFAKQLLQISGLSAEKALAIITTYKTPALLLQAYDQCALSADQEKLLAKLKYGKLQRNLGPALSRQIQKLYCTAGPLL